MKRLSPLLLRFALLMMISGLATAPPGLSAECRHKGTTGEAIAPQPDETFQLTFSYYLPPCYEEFPETRYPVLYLLGMVTQASPIVEALIVHHTLPPVILIMPSITIIRDKYDALILSVLVPYVDSHFRTRLEPRLRGIGGISQSANIAVRTAWQAPAVFGKVAAISGGISAAEVPLFQVWLSATAPAERPRMLIDIGDRDGGMQPYVRNLRATLDEKSVPYDFWSASGGHDWGYWRTRVTMYLMWFTENW
jgi:enterochelin esterase-like enzyme